MKYEIHKGKNEIKTLIRDDNMIPNDPAILLSFVNTKLRDFYSNLDDMCDDMELERKTIEDKLSLIGYKYSEERNQFI